MRQGVVKLLKLLKFKSLLCKSLRLQSCLEFSSVFNLLDSWNLDMCNFSANELFP